MSTTDPSSRIPAHDIIARARESVRSAVRAAHAGDPAPAIDLDNLGPSDTDLERHTPLAEQIAREHLALLNTSTWLIVGCTCDPALTAPPSGVAGSWYAAHIATATEQAVREQIAEGIEAIRGNHPVRRAVLGEATRIARGATDD